VFLILVDVVSKKGFWSFTQKFAKDPVSIKKLENQDSITISFDSHDDLENGDWFVASVLSAEKYLRDLRPSSIAASIDQRKKELEKIDPRLEAEIVATKNTEHVTLIAKEPFDFSVSLKEQASEEAKKAFKELVENGSCLLIDAASVKIEGSPILESSLKQGFSGKLAIKLSHEFSGHADVYSESKTTEFLGRLEGKVKSGTKFLTFDGIIAQGVIAFSLTISLAGSEHETLPLSVRFYPEKWVGQPLRFLNSFGDVHKILKALTHAPTVVFKIAIDGNYLITATIKPGGRKIMSEDFAKIEILSKARFLATSAQLNPNLPDLDSITDRQWTEIAETYELLRIGKFRTTYPNFELKIKFKAELPPPGKVGQGTPRIVSDPNCIDFSEKNYPFHLSLRSIQTRSLK